MKKVSIILSFIALVCFANAQQNAPVTSAKKAVPAMKVDSKPSTINAPVTNSTEPKACCAGKTQAQCTHDMKTCSKEGEVKACCQKGGSMQTCNHGTVEKASEKKAQ